MGLIMIPHEQQYGQYHTVIYKGSEPLKALSWCARTFGHMSDGRWDYNVDTSWVGGRTVKRIFRFPDPNDAMFFKLRWGGE